MHALNKLALIVGIGFMVACGSGVMTRASPPVTVVHDKTPAPHVAFWVMVEGCPKGAFRMVVGLSDGHIVVLDETAPTELLQAARIAIGDLQGTVTAFDCGAQS